MLVYKLMEPVFEYFPPMSYCQSVFMEEHKMQTRASTIIFGSIAQRRFQLVLPEYNLALQLPPSCSTSARGMLGVYNHCGLRVDHHLIDYVDKTDTLSVKKADSL